MIFLVGEARLAIRDAYLGELAELARASTTSAVLAGDLNATVWSPPLRALLKTTGFEDTGRKRGFQATWNRTNPLFALSIDHVLHSDDLRCLSRKIGLSFGSDHRPLVVDFSFE